jgi:hypothetical protein
VIFVCPKTSSSGQHWPKRLARMAVGCASRSAPKAVCPGDENWRPSNHDGGGGGSTIRPVNTAPRGGRMERCLPQRSCSLPLLLLRAAPGASKGRPGPDTQSLARQTGEADAPQLMGAVTPTSATLAAGDIVGQVPAPLDEQPLLPAPHWLARGAVDAEVLGLEPAPPAGRQCWTRAARDVMGLKSSWAF